MPRAVTTTRSISVSDLIVVTAGMSTHVLEPKGVTEGAKVSNGLVVFGAHCANERAVGAIVQFIGDNVKRVLAVRPDQHIRREATSDDRGLGEKKQPRARVVKSGKLGCVIRRSLCTQPAPHGVTRESHTTPELVQLTKAATLAVSDNNTPASAIGAPGSEGTRTTSGACDRKADRSSAVAVQMEQRASAPSRSTRLSHSKRSSDQRASPRPRCTQRGRACAA